MQKNLTHVGVFERKNLRIFYLSLLTCALLLALVFVWGLKKIPETLLWKGPHLFKTENAYNWTNTLAKRFPNRVPWREEKRQAGEYLKGEFRKMGYSPEIMPFDEMIGTKKVTGLENIFAVLPGTTYKDEYVVVLAHYDITDTTVEGATDDASGVGIVLEMARIFKSLPAPKRNFIFLLTDSEEFGAFWGAHQFVNRYPHIRNVVAAVSVDFVAPLKQEQIDVLTDGLHSGYTPLWLRELALSSIRAVPYKAGDTKHLVEFAQRALQIPPSDHGPFLKADVPAFNLFGRSEDFYFEMHKIHHTPLDNMENLRQESFTPFGQAVENMLRTLNQYPALIGKNDLRMSEYLKITDKFYLTGWSITLMQYLLLIPFLIYVFLLVHSLKKFKRHDVWHIAKNELKGFTVLFSSFLVGYVSIRLLPELKIIEKYELFPATQKSELLSNPQYLVLGLVALIIVAFYFLMSRLLKTQPLKKFRALESTDDQRSIQIRHSVLGIVLGAVLIIGFVQNPYLSTLLVLPPSYLWMFMRNNRKLDSKLLNALLFIGGLASSLAVAIAITMVFSLGVLYWYLFLATAYGLVTFYTVLVAVAIIAVGIRVLRNLIL